ncbi:MAG: 30S ribosome-binding factor RbfA [Erysipelotrichia bacterium]|nr:30S ribosome-binding factor RbfA [Candidatus Riflebacteria bacterium]NCB37388.1 30S ribosome-binding factor RbfA [Erysipelotrichia bacterium]
MTRRQEKVSSLILRELSDLLMRKVQDPRVQGVHIVNVDVSPDFHLARVLYSYLNDKLAAEDVQKGLDSAKPFLRRELNKVLQLRLVPELAFTFDPSIKHGDKILELLRNLTPSE